MTKNTSFQDVFRTVAIAEASAPGRVNLLGEHTDYNDGFVLPIAIPQTTTIQLNLSLDHQYHFYSQSLDQQTSFTLTDNIPQGFGSYLYGCIQVLKQQNIEIPPLKGYIISTIPIGAGLSSSAALEIALLRALNTLFKLDLDKVKIAKIGQQAERQYSGVQCGIMDQMASSLGDTNHLLFLDTRTLNYQKLPLPKDTEILILDSGIPRTLAASGYNQRRSECERAAQLLGVKSLRDITDLNRIKTLPFPLNKRAHHVVTENQRVLTACQGLSAEQFGQLMNESHASLRDDYQVSIASLDTLVAALQRNTNVFGAKLTGAGFGGSCVALIKTGKNEEITQQVLQEYSQFRNPTINSSF